jgi:hypothetical protein
MEKLGIEQLATPVETEHLEPSVGHRFELPIRPLQVSTALDCNMPWSRLIRIVSCPGHAGSKTRTAGRQRATH